MDQFYHATERHQDMKFSHLDPKLLAVLSNRDIQLFSFAEAADRNHQADGLRRDARSLAPQFDLKTVIEVGEVTTFEWQRDRLSRSTQLHEGQVSHGTQMILAAHSNGKISLINTYQPSYRSPMTASARTGGPSDGRDQSSSVLTAKTEKVFVTAGMIQSSRHCNTLAWNPCNPRLFAAGYDNSGPTESSLLIWDIEKDMNRHLRNVRKEEEQMQNYRLREFDHQMSVQMMAQLNQASPTLRNNITLGHVESSLGPQIVTECLQSFPNIVEDIYSIEWLPDSENELICATEDQILLCDTRQSFKKENIFQLSQDSKSHISSIKFDPFWNSKRPTNRRFAAYTDDQIFIFDLRISNQVLYQIKSDSLSELEDELIRLKQIQVDEASHGRGVGGASRDDGSENVDHENGHHNRQKEKQVAAQTIAHGDELSRAPSKQFSGFTWCLSRENLIATYSNFKGQSVIKFWDLKEDAIINELNHHLDEQQQQHMTLQQTATAQDHEDKSPSSLDNISHENFEVTAAAQKQGKKAADGESLSKRLDLTLRQNQGQFRWQQNVSLQQLYSPNLLSQEYKSIECQQRIQSLIWKPPSNGPRISIDKNKFIIYTGDGQLQELSFHERGFAVLALSSKGELCMSTQHPQQGSSNGSAQSNCFQLQTIGLISQRELQKINDNQFKYNYQKILSGKSQAGGSEGQILTSSLHEATKHKQASPKDQNHAAGSPAQLFGPTPADKYSESEWSQVGIVKDISQLMLMRIKGGYHLDAIGRNCVLVNGFSDVQNLYSIYSAAQSTSKKRKKASHSALLSSQNARSIRTFWKLMSRVKELASEEWREQNEKPLTDSSNDMMQSTSHMQGEQQPNEDANKSPTYKRFGPHHQPYISFLSDGINGVLRKAIQLKKQQLQIDDDLYAKNELDKEQYRLYEFEIYDAQFRKQVIHFCGWSDVVLPQCMASANPLDAKKMKATSGRAVDQEQLGKLRAELRRCCEAAKDEDGGNHGLSWQPSQDAAQMFVDDNCESIEPRLALPGATSRVTVMACLHFDFVHALDHFAAARRSMPAANYCAGASSVSQAFAEEQTNLNIFENILNSLSEIQRAPAQQTAGPKPRMQSHGQAFVEQMNQKVAMIKEMNKNLHTQMKSPYFEAFFKLIDRNQWSDLFTYWDQPPPKIDVMDFLALMFRFLPLNELMDNLKEFEVTGLREGRLEVLLVMGLNSPKVFLLLQNYVDRTADVQTAAYVAAYAMNIQQTSGLEPKRLNNRLGKFVRAYRDFLNQMQMWSARAVFDQKLGAIVRAASPGDGAPSEQLKMQNARSSGADESNDVTPNIGKIQIPENGSTGYDRAKKRNEQRFEDDENGQLLMFYSHYLQRQDLHGKQNAIGSASAVAAEFAETSRQNATQQLKLSTSSQKNQQDLNSNDVYEGRAFENDIICYFCGGSFTLRKQIDKINEKNSVGAGNVMGTFQMGQPQMMGGMGRPGGASSSAQNAELQKPVSSRCTCEKDVPSCSVCIKPIDLINPHYEIMKQYERRQKASSGQATLGRGGFASMPSMMHGGQSPMLPMGMMNSFSQLGGGISTQPAMANQMNQHKTENPNTEVKSNQLLSNWLIWCQTCKHGGHAQHLTEWFLNFSVCPVSDCPCECTKI